QLDAAEREELDAVREAQRRAWEAFQEPIRNERRTVVALIGELAASSRERTALEAIAQGLERQGTALRRQLQAAAHEALVLVRGEDLPAAQRLAAWRREQQELNLERYGAHLHAGGERSALAVPVVAPELAPDAPVVNGFEVLNA